jgi:tetratricopeptide (TPR) repeat protein
MQQERQPIPLHWVASVIILFLIGRVAGATLFDNGWSFAQWRSTTLTHEIIWLVGFAVLILVLYRFTFTPQSFLDKRWLPLTLLALLALGTAALHFDSFIYGDGNLRVAQLAQSGRIILRWFELGSVGIAALLYKGYIASGLAPNAASVFAWRTFSFLCAAAAAIGAVKFAIETSASHVKRYFLFALLFFGGQTMLLLGFVGVEPVIVPVTIWFSLFMVRTAGSRQRNDLAYLWGIAIAGVILHFSMIYLIPAAVYATVVYLWPEKRTSGLATLGAAAVTVILIALVYLVARQSLEFSAKLLFVQGKSPNTDYGLFSPRHLGDFLQIAFMVSPLLLVALAQVFRSVRSDNHDRSVGGIWWLVIAGMIAAFVLDPVQGIVLDLPRLAAYFTPVSVLLALLGTEIEFSAPRSRLSIALVTAFVVMAPLSYLPVYVRIHNAEAYVSNYFDKHDSFYRTACLAFRDAFFYRHEFKDADHWEWSLPTKSPDMLNLNGTVALSGNNRDNDALGVLHQIVVKNPYWAEPRATIARIQMKLGRYNLAKPEIDTCLMLEPDARDYHVLLYSYYRDTQDYGRALDAARKASFLFPGDTDIQIDLMIINYRAGELGTAELMAADLLARDSTLAFPHLIKGFIAERNKDIPTAVRLYQTFIRLAPKEPEMPAIKEHLEKLQTGLPAK